jgi:hypothetical protein
MKRDLLKLVTLVVIVAFTVGCGDSAARNAPEPTEQEMEENASIGDVPG